MRTSWYLINIVARTNQTPSHYVEAFENLVEQDPLINLRGETYVSARRLTPSIEECNGIPSWITLNLISYVIVDTDAFYSRARKEKVSMEWDSDIVVNFKEADVILIPSKHIVAVKASSKISYLQVWKYFNEALNQIEPDGFDVNVCIDHNFIESIRTANEIVNIKAEISFSNPTSTNAFESFQSQLDDKMREANPEKVDINIYGSKSSPLEVTDDGLVTATLAIAENNGTVEAVVREDADSPYTTVNSKDHPRKIYVDALSGNLLGHLFNYISDLFHG